MTRDIRALLVLAVVGSLLAGCARYTLIEPRPRPVADLYIVDPQTRWSASKDGKWEVWTVDGAALQAVQLLNGLDDGEPLFRAAGAQNITVTNLRPQKFGSADGFRCELAFVTRNGLEKRGTAAGGTVNGRLYLVLYTGTTLHYYEAHREDAERIIQSIRMK